MKYEELIEKALAGKSVNARAKELGMPQKTLDQYVRAKSIPGCDSAIILAKAAGVSIEEAVLAIAAKKAELRPERVHSFLRPAMATVLMALIVVVNLFLTPQKAEAAPRLASQTMSSSEDFVLCKIANKLRAVLARLKRRFFSRTLKPTAT